MSCHRIQKRLSAYQDGEIAGEERERIAAHLEGCPACRSAYAELEQVWQIAGENSGNRGFCRIRTASFRDGSTPFPSPVHGGASPGFPGFIRAYPAPAMAAVLLLVGMVLGGYLGNALVSGFSSAPAQVQVSMAATDIVSFRVFAAAPPGTLGDGYLRMAHFTEEDRK